MGSSYISVNQHKRSLNDWSLSQKKKNENSTPQRVTFAVFTPAKELALAKVLAECKHFPDTPPIPTLASLLASHCGMLRAEILGGGGGGGILAEREKRNYLGAC